MDATFHPLSELFAQLGLDSSPGEIADFLRRHGPLPDDLALPDGPFWTPAQAACLREALDADGDWSEPVDTLNVLLR